MSSFIVPIITPIATSQLFHNYLTIMRKKQCPTSWHTHHSSIRHHWSPMTSSNFLDLKHVVLVLADPVAGWIVVSNNVHSRSFLGYSTSHPLSTFPDHLRRLECFKTVSFTNKNSWDTGCFLNNINEYSNDNFRDKKTRFIKTKSCQS